MNPWNTWKDGRAKRRGILWRGEPWRGRGVVDDENSGRVEGAEGVTWRSLKSKRQKLQIQK